jgi:hypothetical protein
MPAVLIIALCYVIVLLTVIVWWFIDRWYVRKHYMTKEATDKYGEGWSMCHVCGAAPGTIYRTRTKWYHVYPRYTCGHHPQP